VETILITDVASVVGANVAASLSGRYRVVGLSSSSPISIGGCESVLLRGTDSNSIRLGLASVRPQWIVYCAMPAQSAWHDSETCWSQTQAIDTAGDWAAAATETGCSLTMISSDAVFTGPWMFHDEHSGGACQSERARAIRAIEQTVLHHCPSALVARTNTYGWAPTAAGAGWVEQTLSALEAGNAGPYDCHRYATPILATDLAEILESAYRAGLSGVYHVAGAERVNPALFVQHLADRFGFPAPRSAPVRSLSEPRTGFGCGETSLQTTAIRKALAIAMPTLAEGLNRLCEQHQNGYRDLFESSSPVLRDKVA